MEITKDNCKVLLDEIDCLWLVKYSWRIHRTAKSPIKYAQLLTPSGLLMLHRAIMRPEKGQFVDHINGNGLDNRRCNLRIATHAQNMQNRRVKHIGSPYKGVSRIKNSWSATITANGVRYSLGRFKTPEEAARAYDAKAREVHGEFASPNFN